LSSKPSRAVFLRYASQDAVAARNVVEALRAAGVEVWFDQSELRGGDAWDQQIRRQIRDCALFIPIISAKTQARLEGYFRREWKLAVGRTHDMAEEKPFLVPVVLDDTTDRDASVPEPFRAVQWTRLRSGQSPAVFVERIVRLLGVDERRAATPGRPPGASVQAIHSLSSAPSVIPEQSIAVLPFVNMSADKEQEYFSDGLAEELINLLAKIPDLRVPARTSSFSFRGRPLTIGDIGQQLKVANVLEGSVRKAGNRVRITAQLVRADNGYHLWSETFDRNLDDIFQVQDDIAQAVVGKLKLTLLTAVPSATAKSTNSEAHNLYLQGQYFKDRETLQDLDKALACYQRALALDQSYAPAWAGLSAVYARKVANGYVALSTGFALARSAAEKAITLDPTLGEAYATLGVLQAGAEHDWTASAATLARGRVLDPDNPLLLLIAAVITQCLGSAEEAMALYRQALDRDPLNLLVRRYFGRTLYYAGRFAEAESQIRQVLAMSPAYPAASYELGRILLAKGEIGAAVGAFETESASTWQSFGLPLVLHAQQRTAEAHAALAAIDPTGAEFQVAEACAYLGDTDQAFKWLDAADVNRDPGVIWLRADPLLKGLTGDPRYAALLRRLNLPA
jgi:TolB-like protein